MGGFGIAGGGFKAQNFQGGVASIIVDGSGNGSSTVTFRQKMKGSSYGVQLTPNQSGSEIWTTGVLMAGSKMPAGCKIYIRGSSPKSTTLKVAYDAHDDTIN